MFLFLCISLFFLSLSLSLSRYLSFHLYNPFFSFLYQSRLSISLSFCLCLRCLCLSLFVSVCFPVFIPGCIEPVLLYPVLGVPVQLRVMIQIPVGNITHLNPYTTGMFTIFYRTTGLNILIFIIFSLKNYKLHIGEHYDKFSYISTK